MNFQQLRSVREAVRRGFNLTEVAASRTRLAAIAGRTDLPQVLIRVGNAPVLDADPAPTPRRPLDDVLQIRD